MSTRICPFPSCVKTSVEAARPPTRRSPASLRRNGGPCMVALPIPAAPLDNLINLVSPSLPTFFAPATKFLLCPVNPRSPMLCSPFYLPPSLPLSLSLRFLFARQPPLICTTDHGIDGSVLQKGSLSSLRGRGRRDAYRDSGWRDHSKFIRHRSGFAFPGTMNVERW